MMSLVVIIDAIISGKYFMKAGGFMVKLSLAAFIFMIALATKSNWLASLFYDKLWLVTVAAGALVVGVMLYDFRQISKRLRRAATRRCRRRNRSGSRRSTPARH